MSNGQENKGVKQDFADTAKRLKEQSELLNVVTANILRDAGITLAVAGPK